MSHVRYLTQDLCALTNFLMREEGTYSLPFGEVSAKIWPIDHHLDGPGSSLPASLVASSYGVAPELINLPDMGKSAVVCTK
jgi:hypothetical protein